MQPFHALKGRNSLPDIAPEGTNSYEYCRHIPTQPYRSEIVDCEIHLEYIRYPEKKTYKKLIIKVSADENLAKWCAEHPTFKKGTFPLVIFTLHDWLLKTKFFEVQGEGTLEGGTEDQNFGGKMFYTLECTDEEEGTWLVPLADIARTHLFDQLKTFYINNPWAISDPVRRLEVIKEEKKRLLKLSIAKKKEQKIERNKVKRPRERHTLFVDESGDIGFKNIEDCYIFTGVLIPDSKLAEAETGLRLILSRNWQGSVPIELHANKIPESKAEAVKRELAELFLRLNISATSFVFQKQRFAYYMMRRNIAARALNSKEEDPFNVRWNHLFSGDKYFVKANTLAASVELIVTQFFDDYFFGGKHIAIVHDQKRSHWMNTALKIGFKRGVEYAKSMSRDRFGETLEPGLSFSLEHSQNAPGLWFADWICNEVHGWIKHEDFSAAFKSIQHKCKFIGFIPSGELATGPYPGGIASDIFPDSPRLIEEGDPSNHQQD